MSFEISGSLLYDSNRQLSSQVECQIQTADGLTTTAVSPAPYSVPFQLNVYGKTQNDVLQIVEQIIPYFRPSITREYFPITGQPWTDEVTFSLQSVSVEDTFDTDFDSNRVIIYTLDFEARINIYGFINTNEESTLIKSAMARFTNLDGEPTGTTTISVDPIGAAENEPHTININTTFGFE